MLQTNGFLQHMFLFLALTEAMVEGFSLNRTRSSTRARQRDLNASRSRKQQTFVQKPFEFCCLERTRSRRTQMQAPVFRKQTKRFLISANRQLLKCKPLQQKRAASGKPKGTLMVLSFPTRILRVTNFRVSEGS